MGRWLRRVQGEPPHPDLKEQESPPPSVGFVSSVPKGIEKSGRWLNRVEDNREGIDTEPTKLTKAPSVSFVSNVSGHTPKTISVRRAIIRACMGQGITPGNLARGLSDPDLEDIKQGMITIEELREYALFLVMNGYYWSREQPPDNPVPERPAPMDQGQRVDRVPGLWDQEGIAIRDTYINHLMTCGYCYAPLLRLCPEGMEAKARYERASADRNGGK